MIKEFQCQAADSWRVPGPRTGPKTAKPYASSALAASLLTGCNFSGGWGSYSMKTTILSSSHTSSGIPEKLCPPTTTRNPASSLNIDRAGCACGNEKLRWTLLGMSVLKHNKHSEHEKSDTAMVDKDGAQQIAVHAW